jgi:hypothetical protein
MSDTIETLRAQIALLREALATTNDLLDCGPADEYGWNSGHACNRCDDYVDRGAVQRTKNAKLLLEVSKI